MKIRSDHVTNSSSASFTIPKYYLSDYQIDMIKDHINQSENYLKGHRGPQKEIYNDPGYAWRITEDEANIYLSTSMDNFDMGWFLGKIGVSREHIEEEDW